MKIVPAPFIIVLYTSTMTMEELLECLTKKAKLECEEAHRQLVAAINGIAGLHIIQEQVIYVWNSANLPSDVPAAFAKSNFILKQFSQKHMLDKYNN